MAETDAKAVSGAQRFLLVLLASAIGGEIGRAITGSRWFLLWAWFSLIAVVIAALFFAYRVRRREGAYVDWMTSAQPVRLFRLFPLLGLPIAVTLFPVTVVSGLLLVGVTFPDWPPWARSLSGWGLLAWTFAGAGLCELMAYRPPKQLMPSWLRDQYVYTVVTLPGDNSTPLWLGLTFLIVATLALVAGFAGAAGVRGL